MNEGVVREPTYAFMVIALALILFGSIGIVGVALLVMIRSISWVEFLTGLAFFVTGVVICYYLIGLLLEM